MTIAVLLAFLDGHKEFVPATHVHGFRDGRLLIATGTPGAGLDAEVVRTVAVAELAFAETCEQHDPREDDADGPDWSMTWPEG